MDMGLASHAVPKGQLKGALEVLVTALLAKPPEALRQTQALLRRVDTQEVLDRMELENSHFAERLQSDEVKGAIAAFFASRTKTPA
jgi:enoyl-CoA hydratase/carnithine racemase